MKVLVACRLPTLLEAKLKALLAVERVEEVHVIRYYKGPPLDGVTYHCPPRILGRIPIVRILSNFLLALIVGFRHKPDFIVGYYLVSHGIVATATSKILRKPVVVSLIGTDFSLHLRRSYGWLLIKILFFVDVIAVKGERSRDALVALSIPKENIFIVHNFLDLEKFKQHKMDKIYDVVSVGRLINVKRMDFFLEVVAELKKKFPQIKTAIVGEGPLQDRLEEKRSMLGLKDNVSFLGFRRDIPEILNQSRIFLLTSEEDELPFSMMEALACGLPVVVPDVGNISEVISSEENGFIIESSLTSDYEKAVSRLLNEDELREHISQNNRRLAQGFGVGRVRKEWGRIFDFLEGKRPTR
ncbi:glycosyltransferase family 4 protein [Candidatus Altiarchaeota archaeon]